VNIVFKEWLPDQPALGNPGLIRAQNVIPRESGYSPFKPLDQTGGTHTAGGVSGSFMSFGVTKSSARIYGYNGSDFFVGSYGGPFSTLGGAFTVGASNDVGFDQYENYVIAVGDSFATQHHTVGSASNFSNLASNGTAPPAQALGIIGQFVVIGNLGTAGATQRPNVIQWGGVDAPRSWPTPGSSTAIAQQAGEQELPSLYGEIQAIHGGDQRGLILQKRGATRMTYTGPPAVFQFDTLSNVEGSFFPRGSIRVGDIVYFISQQGFCRTDGVSIQHIGAGKVDRIFWDNVNTSELRAVTCGYDAANDLVYFAYPVSSTTNPDTLLIFNPKTGHWTQAIQAMEEFVGGSWNLVSNLYPLTGFSTAGSASVVGKFGATAGAAVLETGDIEFTEGGRSFVDGLKPHVESAATAPSIGVRIGVRNDLGTTPSYTTTANAHSRTGYANFRNAGVTDGKYHRAELTITGEFKKVTGFDADVIPTGKA
jgi:hypothetical protein